MDNLPAVDDTVATTDTVKPLRAGIGASTADPTAAAEAATQAALAQLDGSPPALVMVLSSVRYDLPRLLARVRGTAGDVPVVGATTSGHLYQGQLAAPGTGVAVLALAGDRYRFGVASVTGVRADAFTVGRQLARAARDAAGAEDCPHSAIMLRRRARRCTADPAQRGVPGGGCGGAGDRRRRR